MGTVVVREGSLEGVLSEGICRIQQAKSQAACTLLGL